jgi:PAS domain S-box-containing protein
MKTQIDSKPKVNKKPSIENLTGYYASGGDGKIIECNNKFADIFGFPAPEEAIGSNDTALYKLKSDRTGILKKLKSRGELVRKELRMRRIDGKEILIEHNLTGEFDKEGKLISYKNYIFDLTPQQEEPLEKFHLSKLWYQKILETAIDGFLIFDENGNIQEANDAYASLSGYSKEDLRNMKISDIEYLETENEIKERIGRVKKKGNESFESKHKTKSGKAFDIEASLSYLPGKKDYLITFVRDISDIKKNFKKLEEKEKFISAIANTIPGIIYIVDVVKNKTTLVNTKFEDIVGYTVEEIHTDFDEFLYSLVHVEDRFVFRESLKILQSSPTDKVVENEYRIRHKSGKWLWFSSIESIHSRNQDGTVHEVLGFAQDVTARKEAEHLLKESELNNRIISEMISDYVYSAKINNEGKFESEWMVGAVEKITGYTFEEIKMLPDDFRTLIIPEDFEKIMIKKRGKLNNAHHNEFEYRIKTKYGEIKWLKDYSKSVKSEVNIGIQIIGAVKDITEAKNAQLKLTESEANLRAVLNNSMMAFVLIDLEGKIRLFNTIAENRARALFNSEIHEGDSIQAFAEKYELSELTEAIETAMKGKVVYKERQFITTNYEVRYFDFMYYPVKNEKDTIIGVCLTALDVTQKKKAEVLLKESEEKFKTLFNSGNDAIYVMELKGELPDKIEEVNDNAPKMLGYSKEELKLFNPYQLQSGLDMEQIKSIIQRLKKEKSVLFQTYHESKDGRKIPVEVSSALFKYKNQDYILSIARDISERIENEKELLKLYAVVEQSDQEIVIIDRNGIIEYANTSFCKNLKTTLTDIKQKNDNIFSLIAGLDKIEELGKELNEHGFWQKEIEEIQEDELVWYLVRIKPIKNEFNEVINYVLTREDITLRKKLLDDLISAKEKAEVSNRLKSEFLAQVSHEIRTPLNAILSFSNLIQEQPIDIIKVDGETIFESMNSSARRIIRTIDLILNMSEVQTDSYDFRPSVINLEENVIRPIEIEFRELAKLKGLEFNVEIKRSDKKIFGDLYSVNQIFVNLVDNAIKFTKQGKVEIILSSEEDKITVDVIDTGIGISEEYLPNIVNPFSQEEQGYTRKFEGTGLGMALVKKYCEMNQAVLHITSKKSEGSKFSVIFDKYKEE